ncbi:MAG: alanine--glyoxylate aminotransferase family protein [Myxococcota bacterium]
MSDFVFDPPQRILLGPGPSDVPARVLAALARPTVGYMDRSYTDLLAELQRQLRLLFRTTNEETLTITGPGTAAMEAAIYNVVEPGDRVVACVHGYFADRMRQMAERCGGAVTVVEAPWGEPVDPDAVRAALEKLGGAKLVTVTHGETSTGVCQPIEALSKAAHDHGALMCVDTVASLGGAEFATDAWGVDLAYTGSQKCLSVPPGISPLTVSPRAMEVVNNRKTPCASWFLDLLANLTVWRRPNKYHHTGAVNLSYALHEGLAIIEEEGLAQRVARVRTTAEALWAGLEAMGLSLVVAEPHRLPTLTTVRVPDGVDEAAVRAELMAAHGIEIAGGLGPFAGTVWRIGLMGASCSTRNVTLLLSALEGALSGAGYAVPPGAVAAARARLG